LKDNQKDENTEGNQHVEKDEDQGIDFLLQQGSASQEYVLEGNERTQEMAKGNSEDYGPEETTNCLCVESEYGKLTIILLMNNDGKEDLEFSFYNKFILCKNSEIQDRESSMEKQEEGWRRQVDVLNILEVITVEHGSCENQTRGDRICQPRTN
jgi:hypothetical protein